MESSTDSLMASSQYGFDEFYMDVIDRLMLLAKRPNIDQMTGEYKKLDELREFLEYIEDREFYYHRVYKPDVMKYVSTRVGHLVTFHDVLSVFTKERKPILDIIYQKDRVYEEKRSSAAADLFLQR